MEGWYAPPQGVDDDALLPRKGGCGDTRVGRYFLLSYSDDGTTDWLHKKVFHDLSGSEMGIEIHRGGKRQKGAVRAIVSHAVTVAIANGNVFPIRSTAKKTSPGSGTTQGPGKPSRTVYRSRKCFHIFQVESSISAPYSERCAMSTWISPSPWGVT